MGTVAGQRSGGYGQAGKRSPRARIGRRARATIVALLIVAGGLAAASAAHAQLTGIWYSTWYSHKGNYVWIQGHGWNSGRQFLADVTGDGKADAVVFFPQDGCWYVAESTGSYFGGVPLQKWICGHGVGSENQFVSDVTGDGKADAVVFEGSNGCWHVADSTGSYFGGVPLQDWICGHGVGSENQFVGDVTGDGKADAVVWEGSNGCWHVADSTGTYFGGVPLKDWICGHGVGSEDQFVGDVTGDGKADAVVWERDNGCWYVAESTGSIFSGVPLT